MAFSKMVAFLTMALLIMWGAHADAKGDAAANCGPSQCNCPNRPSCTAKATCDWCANGCRLKTTYASDVNNCGKCGAACSFTDAAASCSGGKCHLGDCSGGFANCDGDSATGCETTLSDPTTCGSCTNNCKALPNVDVGSTTCSGKSCQLSCSPPYEDCNNSPGCETNLLTSDTHCGACETDCTALPNAAASTCLNGVCQLECDADFAHCGTDPSSGCETDLSSNANCGTCFNNCGLLPNAGASTCSMDHTCQLVCDSGFEDCNNDQSDGCETDTSKAFNQCGTCTQTFGQTTSVGVSICQSGYQSSVEDCCNSCINSKSQFCNCVAFTYEGSYGGCRLFRNCSFINPGGLGGPLVYYGSVDACQIEPFPG